MNLSTDDLDLLAWAAQCADIAAFEKDTKPPTPPAGRNLTEASDDLHALVERLRDADIAAYLASTRRSSARVSEPVEVHVGLYTGGVIG